MPEALATSASENRSTQAANARYEALSGSQACGASVEAGEDLRCVVPAQRLCSSSMATMLDLLSGCVSTPGARRRYAHETRAELVPGAVSGRPAGFSA